MTHQISGALKRITLATVTACLFSTINSVAHAYTMSSEAKGDCPHGYYRAVTEPAEFPVDYKDKVTEYLLPANVCLKRVKYAQFNSRSNFSVEDFITIDGGTLQPFASVEFSGVNFEAVMGHYPDKNGSYTASTISSSSTYNDFTGVHPFLISRSAGAAIKYKNGRYLINKITTIGGDDRDTVTTVCPRRYSTVGGSSACYSQTNGLGLNANKKLELIELKKRTKHSAGQKCPLGYAKATQLGSNGGICTAVEALYTKADFGLNVTAQGVCPGGEVRANGVCLPQLTAIYCEINSQSQSIFTHKYKPGRHVMIRPTKTVTHDEARLNFSDHFHSVGTGRVKATDLKKYLDYFPYDEAFFNVSPIDRGSIPMLHLYSGLACENIWDSGYSVDPIPMWW